jgi:hypothetical protein
VHVYGLAKVQAEDTQNGSAVYYVSARAKVYCTVVCDKGVDQLIYVVDFAKMDCKSFHIILPPIRKFIKKMNGVLSFEYTIIIRFFSK